MEKCSCEKTPTTTIASKDDLDLMMSQRFMPHSRIQIEIPGIPYSMSHKAEKRLNRSRVACGCETGSYFMGAGMLLVTLMGITGKLHLNWSDVGYAMLIIVGSAFVGKTIGLIYARWVFTNTLKSLRKFVSVDTLLETVTNPQHNSMIY